MQYTQGWLQYLLGQAEIIFTLLTFIFHQVKLPSFLASPLFSPFSLWPLSSQIPFLGLPSVFYSKVNSWSIQIALYHQHKAAVRPALPLWRSQIMTIPTRMDGHCSDVLFVSIANHITSYTTDQKCFKRTSLLIYSRLHYWASVVVVHFLSVEVCIVHNQLTHIYESFGFPIYSMNFKVSWSVSTTTAVPWFVKYKVGQHTICSSRNVWVGPVWRVNCTPSLMLWCLN